MRTNNMKLETLTLGLAWGFASTVILLMLIGILLLVIGWASASFAQEAQPRTFLSPEEASNALFQAAQKDDEPALEAILGAGKEVTSSSDAVDDKLEREQFSKKYEEMHRLVREDDGSTVLYIGAENWPFPVPLVSKNGAWYFDSKAGIDEIKFRRVGENEAIAIEVAEEFALAKGTKDDVKEASLDPLTRFAESLAVANATNADVNAAAPFHGYYFRTVTGAAAVAKSSDAFGEMKKGGVVLVAYPAEYRSSGVKTFIVLQGGVVYEKDLGPDTATVAPMVKARNLSWHWVGESPLSTNKSEAE
jgi:hypothetical protein